MKSLRTNRGRWWLLIALWAWVIGLSVQQVHPLLVEHVVCSDHGEVMELAGGRHTASQPTAPGVKASPQLAHDHDCLLMGVTLSGLTPSALVHTRRLVWPPTPVASVLQGAPRGPPLHYAPKTSPPVQS